MAKGDVFQGEVSSGFETGDDRRDDDFEHLDMLYSDQRNSNDTNRTDYLVGTRV